MFRKCAAVVIVIIVIGLVGVAAIIASAHTTGDPQATFLETLDSRGEDYLRLRNELVEQGEKAIPMLRGHLESAHWKEALLADVLLGRSTRPDDYRRYEEVLAEATEGVQPWHVWGLAQRSGGARRASLLGCEAVSFFAEQVLFRPPTDDRPVSGVVSLRLSIAVLALGLLDDDRTIPVLCHSLDVSFVDQRDDNPVAFALKDKGPNAADTLAKVVAKEDNPWKMLVAGNALALMGDHRAGSLLTGVLQDRGEDKYDFYTRVRLAARILRDHPYPEAQQALENVLDIYDTYAAGLVESALAACSGALSNYPPHRQIPVTVEVLGETDAFDCGEELPISLKIHNGLSGAVRFVNFSLEPNYWNGETANCQLVNIYRLSDEFEGGRSSNLYIARPEVAPPVVISGMSAHTIYPGKSLTVRLEMSKWKLREPGWVPGSYSVTFRVDRIRADDFVTMSVLSEPFTFSIR